MQFLINLVRWLHYTLHKVSTNGTMSGSSGYNNKVAATITERFHSSYLILQYYSLYQIQQAAVGGPAFLEQNNTHYTFDPDI